MVFSPGAAARGAGKDYPVGSPLRPKDGRILFNDGSPGEGADAGDVALAVQFNGAGGFPVGEGFLPAAGALQPAVDSALNYLGSGAVYDVASDIGGELSIVKLKKAIKSADYFGASTGDAKVYNRSVTTLDLLRFAEEIERFIRPYAKFNYIGGTFMDFLMDPNYEPTLVAGRSYFPGPEETWSAFTADATSVIRFNNRKKILRQHVADIVLEFSEPVYWRATAQTVPDRTDGQAMIKKWMGLFHDESIVSVTARAKKLTLREYQIQGAEDPSAKIQDVFTEWTSLRLTGFGLAQYSPSWLANVVLGMVSFNPHYLIWRQSGGANILLRETNPAIMQQIIIDVWADNRVEWERADKKAAGARARGAGGGGPVKKSRVGAGSSGASGSGGRDISTVRCYNCNKMGHYANACPSKKMNGKGPKGDGKSSKGGKAARAAAVNAATAKGRTSWLTPPCTYAACDGDRKSHATVDCAKKIADDKKSVRVSNQKDKDKAEATKAGNHNTVDHRYRRARMTKEDDESDSDSQ